MQNPPSLCKLAKLKMQRIQRDKIPRAIFRIIDAICASLERPGLTSDITAFQPSRAYPESFTPAGKGTGWAVAGVPLEGGGGEVTREGYSRTLPKTLKYWQPDGRDWTQDAGRGGVGKERLPHLRALSRKPSVKDPSPPQVPRPVAGDRCCRERGGSLFPFSLSGRKPVPCAAPCSFPSGAQHAGDQSALQAPQGARSVGQTQQTPGGRRDSWFAFGGNN